MRLLTTTLPDGTRIAEISDLGFSFIARFVPNARRDREAAAHR